MTKAPQPRLSHAYPQWAGPCRTPGLARRRAPAHENVKHFQPILQQALQACTLTADLLLTSRRTSLAPARTPGPLIQAIHAWPTIGTPQLSLSEDWLLDPGN